MSFADYTEEELIPIRQGLKLIGWSVDMRLTSDDASFVEEIALEALKLYRNKKLTDDIIDNLSFKAYDHLVFQLMNIEERSSKLTYNYKYSKYLGPNLSIIDEAVICWYKGYYFASSALLFIATENCLRNIIGWKAGDRDPTFRQLKESILKFENSHAKQLSLSILNIIYSRYDPLNPTRFYFNRHGILHGVRSATEFDELNAVRLIILFDQIIILEECFPAVIINEEFRERVEIFRNCSRNKNEMRFIHRI